MFFLLGSSRPFAPVADLRLNRLHAWAALLVCLCLSIATGCATAPALNTSTGKPEVTIRNASKGAIFDAIADQMLSNDYLLKGRSENVAVFAKRRAIFLQESVTEFRVIYNLIDTPAGVRVMAAMVQFVNANTPMEKLDVDFSRHPKTAPGIQSILDHVRTTLENRPVLPVTTRPPVDQRAQALAQLETTVEPDAPCAIPVAGLKIAGNKIMEVTAGGPAEKAGLQPGDVLMTIDGKPATTSLQNGARLNGKTDTSVVLGVQRGDRLLKIAVIRESPQPEATPPPAVP